jgi:hypothetical protein
MRRLLKEYIRMLLAEINMSDLTDVCYTGGSTHIMRTCKIDGENFYLKFSNEDLFHQGSHPSMQILIEYLAYAIYALYEGINIPNKIHLVFDRDQNKVGIATSPIKGKQGFHQYNPKFLAKMMSKGVYVDIFLANWDVIGTGTGNVFVDWDGAEQDDSGGLAPGSKMPTLTRMDPGGAITKRAMGGDKPFGDKVGELQTMTKQGFGAGNVYQYADLEEAASTFTSVSWEQIAGALDGVNNEVVSELKGQGYEKLLSQWTSDFSHIKGTMKNRYAEILKHIGWVESNH